MLEHDVDRTRNPIIDKVLAILSLIGGPPFVCRPGLASAVRPTAPDDMDAGELGHLQPGYDSITMMGESARAMEWDADGFRRCEPLGGATAWRRGRL